MASIVCPSNSSVTTPIRAFTIGGSEPPGSLSTKGNPRVAEITGWDSKEHEESTGSQVQILSARQRNHEVPETQGFPGLFQLIAEPSSGPDRSPGFGRTCNCCGRSIDGSIQRGRLSSDPGNAAQCDLWSPPRRIPLKDETAKLLHRRAVVIVLDNTSGDDPFPRIAMSL